MTEKNFYDLTGIEVKLLNTQEDDAGKYFKYKMCCPRVGCVNSDKFFHFSEVDDELNWQIQRMAAEALFPGIMYWSEAARVGAECYYHLCNDGFVITEEKRTYVPQYSQSQILAEL